MKLRSSLKKTCGVGKLKKRVSFEKNEITISKLDLLKKWLNREINNIYSEYCKSSTNAIKYYNTDKYPDILKNNNILYNEYIRKKRAMTIINNKKINSIENDFYKSYYNKYCEVLNKN